MKINPAFKSLIPPLDPVEYDQLEENLLRDGCRDPLVTWGDVLIDGHHRLEICQRHGLKFETRGMEFESEQAAADWIDANQLGRRNLWPEASSLLRGRRYNRAKKANEGSRGNQYREAEDKMSTAATLAAQHGVDERTIRRDGALATAVETLTPAVPDIAARVMAGDIPSRQAVIEAARDPETAAERLSDLRSEQEAAITEEEIIVPLEKRLQKRTVFRPVLGKELGGKALIQLQKIANNDKQAAETFQKVIDYCQKRLADIPVRRRRTRP